MASYIYNIKTDAFQAFLKTTPGATCFSDMTEDSINSYKSFKRYTSWSYKTLDGIVKGSAAPEPVNGDSYSKNLDKIPSDWFTAIKLFENGSLNKTFYSDSFIEVFSNLKKQELRTFAERMEDFETLTYMNSV